MIGLWTLKIFGVVRKLLHEFQCISMVSKWKKGHNLVKMLDRVMKSWLVVGGMMVNKCGKFHSNRTMDVENI